MKTPGLTSYERSVYQALTARGVPHELAVEDALDGLTLEAARRVDYDPTPCCPDPGCPGRGGGECTFPGYADNH